jgi:hypothetical protein
MLTYNFWMVKIPLPVRNHVGQLARAERRKATDMLRIILEDATRAARSVRHQQQ